jgi:hypothetical protein
VVIVCVETDGLVIRGFSGGGRTTCHVISFRISGV